MQKTYESIRDTLDTGDLVLFSGTSHVSNFLKLCTFSKWSHVGMVVRIPDWDQVLLWESTTLGHVQDFIDGKAKRGVQTVLLSERIRAYRGDVAIRQLTRFERTDEMRHSLCAFRRWAKNRDYEQRTLELIRAAYDGPFGENQEDLSSLFCSELVAEAYQRMGLLSDDLPSNEYTPRDFSSENKRLAILGGAMLTDEIEVRYELERPKT